MKNTLQYYPGLLDYQNRLRSSLVYTGEYDRYCLSHLTEKEILKPDFSAYRQYFLIRYNLNVDVFIVRESLTIHGTIHNSVLDHIMIVDGI